MCNNYNSGEQAKFGMLLEKKYGFGIMQELETLRQKPKKWTIEELLQIEEIYEEKINDL